MKNHLFIFNFEAEKMTEFRINVLLFFLLLCSIVFINLKQDPHSSLRGTGEEKRIVKRLKQGKNSSLKDNLNIRILRKLEMRTKQEPRDLAVIGGSTSIEISEKMLDSVSIHNYSVFNPSIEDYEALYTMYLKTAPLCNHLIFDLSAFSFLEESGDLHSWIPLSSEYLAAQHFLGSYSIMEEARVRMAELDDLLSIPSFRKSVKQLRSKKPKRSGDLPMATTIYADGSWNRMSVADSLNRLRPNPLFTDIGFKPSSPIVDKKVRRLKVLLEHAVDHQQVWVVLSPFSPSLYAEVLRHNTGIIEFEKKLYQFAQKHQIRILGSFNPKNLGLEEDDFMDPVHWYPYSKKEYFKSIHLSDSLRLY